MFISTFAIILADATSNDPWYIKLASFAGGIIATFVGFLLNQSHQNYREKIKQINEYNASLQSSANELEFYSGKLKQLSGELENLAEKLDRRDAYNWITPTYSLYPNFLEKCKITINTFHKNPNLVKQIGHCHFELCHILARLDLHKEQMSVQLPTGLLRENAMAVLCVNVKGFKGLIDLNIPVFKATCDIILAEKTKMEGSLELLKERGPFSNLVE